MRVMSSSWAAYPSREAFKDSKLSLEARFDKRFDEALLPCCHTGSVDRRWPGGGERNNGDVGCGQDSPTLSGSLVDP